MADNKLLLRRDADENFLADDDPLAELARIVGFDSGPMAKVAAPQRREPAFDLEDELLKELEIYAQPTAVEAEVVAVPAFDPAALPQPAYADEPESAASSTVEAERAFETEPVLAEPVERAAVALEAVETYADAAEGRVYERPAAHPVFDLEDEILREFAAFDARRVTPREEHPVEAEIVTQDASGLVDMHDELHEAPDVRLLASAAVEGREIYDSFRDDDLDAAINFAADPRHDVDAPDMADVVSETTAVEFQPVIDGDIEPAIDPVADETSVDLSAGELPQFELSDTMDNAPFDEIAGASVDHVTHDDEPDLANAETLFATVADETPAASQVEPVMQAVAFDGDRTPATTSSDYGIDDLLAEVEKYPVVESADRWGVQSKAIAPEDLALAAAPTVQDFSAVQPETITIHEVDTTPAVSWTEPEIAFDESQLEIDLGEIDLDLSDLGDPGFADSEAIGLDVREAEPAKVMPAIAPAPVVEPAPFAPVSANAAADYSSLPFDPSQISQEEEVVETIAEMNVPDVLVVHDEDRSITHPEYDLDLDAEMAHLFATSTAPAAASPRSSQDNVVAFESAAAKAQATALDLDEFERALEEDFRRSLTDNRSAAAPDRVALAPMANVSAPRGSRRGWLLISSAAAAIVLFGGAGVYAFMSGDTPILASSEPKVILADTEPVKIVPDEPGGRQVPNQNKAVYDRVSGTQPDQLKQESLVSSNEEPIDVVQRTLEPEYLPMNDDSMALATPTGDTVDPRLLPDEAEQDRVTTTNKIVSGVSPRKVKTMVVRSDGTLVEREVTEDDLKQQAANDAELLKIAQKAAQDAATASDSQADDIAKTIDSVPERLAPADAVDDKSSRVTATVPDTAKPAETVDVDPIDAARVTNEQPVAAEKVADEAAKAIETTELKPVEPVQVEKPVERSIAVESEDSVAVPPVADQVATTPADQTATTAADQTAVAAAAEAQVEDAPVRKVKTTKIAPVPENRPVDQPVTVVGTVTDQGVVRSEPEAKTQEVAAVDQKAQTPVATTPVSGAYVIQIASLPSEAEAQTSYSRLSSKFAGIIGGRGVDIRKAEIKNKGTYYRVRIPAGSKQEAQALCSQYKSAGGSCLVSK